MEVAALQIKRAPNDYSDFGPVDLDRECESTYYKNYRLVSAFVAAEMGVDDADTAGVALRPLLEGHLHRRFPGAIPDGVMLGEALSRIADATTPSPLVHAQHHVPELRTINAFAGKFHHDTNPDRMTFRPDPTAVVTYARRVLNFIHGASV